VNWDEILVWVRFTVVSGVCLLLFLADGDDLDGML